MRQIDQHAGGGAPDIAVLIGQYIEMPLAALPFPALPRVVTRIDQKGRLISPTIGAT
jgi:hypothetical protein